MLRDIMQCTMMKQQMKSDHLIFLIDINVRFLFCLWIISACVSSLLLTYVTVVCNNVALSTMIVMLELNTVCIALK